MTRIITTLIFFFLTAGLALNSQVDQVSIGAAYSKQAYYKISTGEFTQVSNDSWDIAFSTSGLEDAGVFINESASFMEEAVKLYLAGTNDWSQSIDDSSVFTEDKVLYNPKINLIEGAFNSIADVNNPLDYGWGEYNSGLETVVGTKIFVIEKRDGSYIKFQIEKLEGVVYSFRFANLDGSDEVTAVVSKNDADGAGLIYYSFETQALVEIPKDYDLIFQRYSVLLDDGTGNMIPYTVAGVLLGPETEAVIADGIDPNNVNEADYANDYSPMQTAIGHDWKFFDFEAGWLVDTDRVYFVKTSDENKYKIQFYDFGGSSTGITTLEKIKLSTTSTIDINESNISIYPNPTSDYVTINTKHDAYDILVYNGVGQLVLEKNKVNQTTQLNLTQFNEGIYRLVLRNKAVTSCHTIVVTK